MTVDTLVTKYVLDDQYSAKAGAIQNATGGLSASFMGAAQIGGTILGAGLLAAGQRAITTAAGFEVLEQSLLAVTGSMTRAKEVFSFVQQQAGPSAFFGVKELGEAAKLLEAFKLKTEEFLPLGNTMASLFGQNAESLNSFVMALGRIKAGSFGEGFERLREMGVTRPMLEAQGAQFNGQGQFQGTTDAALQAIKKAIEKNFGGLDAAMQGTFQAQLATAGDTVEQAFGKVGKGINEALLPNLKSFNAELGKFVADGRAEKMGEEFATLMESLKSFGEGIRNLLSMNPTVQFAEGFGGWLAKRVFKTSNAKADALNAATDEMQKDPTFKKYMDSLGTNAEAFAGDTPESVAPSPTVRQNTVFLGEIASNTRDMASSLHKMAFGAGASAAGVTTSELSDFSNGRRGGGGRVAGAIRGLVDAISAEMLDTVNQADTTRRASFGRA